MRCRIVLFLLLAAAQAGAQDTASVTEGFHSTPDFTGRKILSSVTVGGLLAGSLVSSYFDWWNNDSRPFHFVHEGWFNDYSLGIDKVGHAYTSYFYFRAFRDILLWGGLQPASAFWWAAGTTTFFAVSVEIGDGVSPYGFSFEDLSANMLGLGYAMLQLKFNVLRNINLKWSYVPPDGYRWPPRFTDHYDGHTYWLTFNMHNLLPSRVGESWPEFLQLAAGYGVGSRMTKREFVFGLDLNLSAFKPQNEDVLLLERTADMIHLPAPAVKFTPGGQPRYYLFHLN